MEEPKLILQPWRGSERDYYEGYDWGVFSLEIEELTGLKIDEPARSLGVFEVEYPGSAGKAEEVRILRSGGPEPGTGAQIEEEYILWSAAVEEERPPVLGMKNPAIGGEFDIE